MTEQREPLVPSECDLRGLQWMPLDTVSLLDSDLNAISTGDEFKAAVRLWCKAWYQVPASSLPDDDRILATLSGFGLRWKKLRDVALRGFVKCTDGRLYHPVIAEKALEAWERRDEFLEKTNNKTTRQQRWRDRQKKISEELRDLGVTPPVGASLSTLKRLLVDAKSSTSRRHVDAQETPKRGTGTGQGPKETKLSAAPRRPRVQGDVVPVTLDLWNSYASAYQQRYGVQPTRNAKVNGQLASFLNRVPGGDAPNIAAFYVGHDKNLYVSSKHCVDLLLRDAEGLRTEWLTGRKVTDTQARQADRTAATGSLVEDLLAEKRRAVA